MGRKLLRTLTTTQEFVLLVDNQMGLKGSQSCEALLALRTGRLSIIVSLIVLSTGMQSKVNLKVETLGTITAFVGFVFGVRFLDVSPNVCQSIRFMAAIVALKCLRISSGDVCGVPTDDNLFIGG